MRYYFEAFRKYAVFRGRSTRGEYWYFVLVNALIVGVLTVIADASRRAQAGQGVYADVQGVLLLYYLATVVPSYALSIRRLHDTGRSGWWSVLIIFCGICFGVIPVVPGLTLLVIPALIALIVMIWLFLLDSQPGTNRFGPNPRSQELAQHDRYS